MATPNYFKEMPDVNWAIKVNKAGLGDSVLMKDYFRQMTIRDSVWKETSLYTEYVIKSGERPDQISYEVYGTEKFYWVILQINEIVDYYNQWPLSLPELEKFIIKKYGSEEKAGEIHHYETVEAKDINGNIILEAGLVVPENFVYSYPPNPEESVFVSSLPVAVSNREYEQRINDDKENIVILDPKYIFDYEREYNLWMRRKKNTKSETYIE